MTPYFTDTDVTLYLGDMRTVLPALDLTVDCVIADPPYGETSLAWDRWPNGWPDALIGASRSMWCFGSMRMFLDRRDDFTIWRLSQDLVMEKGAGAGMHNDRFRRVHEMITHWYRGRWGDIWKEPQREPEAPDARPGKVIRSHKPVTHGQYGKPSVWLPQSTRLMRSVLRTASMRGQALHPTEKPVGILAPLIEYACPPGGLILDPFAGSGSTALAARLTAPNPHAAAFPEWRTEHGAMAMEITAGHGVAHGVNGAHVASQMREWEGGTGASTPVPQARFRRTRKGALA